MLERITLKHISSLILLLKLSLITIGVFTILPTIDISHFSVEGGFLWYVLIGFLAQLVDGALGMAYGLSCSSLLLCLGVSPAVATASVHTAEVFTTGASGLSHLYFQNIDRKLFFRLVITGVIGAVLGAFLISKVLNGNFVKPLVAIYLLILGAFILKKGLKYTHQEPEEVKNVGILGFFGGLLDAIGGGGWGPVVTSNIISQGKNAKETIGTVNTAEFFVAFFSTGVFLLFVGIDSWKIVVGLIVGGVLAAPIGALLANKINNRTLMLLVGCVIILTSLVTIGKVVLPLL